MKRCYICKKLVWPWQRYIYYLYPTYKVHAKCYEQSVYFTLNKTSIILTEKGFNKFTDEMKNL